MDAGQVSSAANRQPPQDSESTLWREGREPAPLLVITGPTAAGKTAIAVRVACRVPAEIVSADSMAVYRGMDIGTAKPTPAQRRRARFHLVDYVQPDEAYSLARFLEDAKRAIEGILEAGRLPIVCGGTGLYISALLHGFSLPPTDAEKVRGVREVLQQRLEREGLAPLAKQLLEADPEAGQYVDLKNPRRVIRALEVVAITGRPVAAARGRQGPEGKAYNATVFVVTCPRPTLYRRIDLRVDAMMAAGWLDEVKGLLRKMSAATTALQAIGYRHLLQHLNGGPTLEETVRLIKRDTRRLAKRQLTWWRRETQARWIGWETRTDLDCVELVLARVARGLLAEWKAM